MAKHLLRPLKNTGANFRVRKSFLNGRKYRSRKQYITEVTQFHDQNSPYILNVWFYDFGHRARGNLHVSG
jgi:hypothetical protein